MEYQVVIPKWVNHFRKSNKTKAKYWLWTDRERLPLKHRDSLRETPLIIRGKAYCCNQQGERYLKNTKSAGKPNVWILNGQDLYNAKLDWRVRKNVAKFYHEYLAAFIERQLKPINIPEGKFLSISCDIYDVKRGQMPDVSNMWLLEKFFEDALQECGIIPDDNPDYVRESGRKKYHFVENEDDRQLVFTIKVIDP